MYDTEPYAKVLEWPTGRADRVKKARYWAAW